MTDTVRITVEVDVDQSESLVTTPEKAALYAVIRDVALHDDPGVRIVDVELLA